MALALAAMFLLSGDALLMGAHPSVGHARLPRNWTKPNASFPCGRRRRLLTSPLASANFVRTTEQYQNECRVFGAGGSFVKKIGEKRYRGEVGRYYEDFEVGDVYEHRPGRTITDADNINFSLMTMNQHPMHCDAAYAAKSEFGRPLVNSGLTVAIVLGMTVQDVSGKAIANLGWQDIKLTGPVFPGDTIYAESEVLDKRESRSRPGAGIVKVRTTGKKADGSVFMTFDRSALIQKRDGNIDDQAGY
jgi:itaconyl-CoA hydratase